MRVAMLVTTKCWETLDDAREASTRLRNCSASATRRPALAKLAQEGSPIALRFRARCSSSWRKRRSQFQLQRLKTRCSAHAHAALDEQRARCRAAFQEAVADVLVAKSLARCANGLERLVVAGVAPTFACAPARCPASRGKFSVFYPAMEFCTDNGAMIALAGCLRLKTAKAAPHFHPIHRQAALDLPPC